MVDGIRALSRLMAVVACFYHNRMHLGVVIVRRLANRLARCTNARLAGALGAAGHLPGAGGYYLHRGLSALLHKNDYSFRHRPSFE